MKFVSALRVADHRQVPESQVREQEKAAVADQDWGKLVLAWVPVVDPMARYLERSDRSAGQALARVD